MVRAGQYFNNTGYGLIDSLNYTYSDPLSNQLTNIFEQTLGIQKNKGFKPGPSSGYLYDENGNLISDTHKNMSIQYNYLNLPETINFAGGNQIVYLYDATGKKLQKKVSPDNTGTTTLNQNPIPSDTYQDNVIESAGNVPIGHEVFFKGTSRITLKNGFKGYGRFRGENTGTIVQDYCNGIEYHCSALEAIYHSEGRLYFNGGGERYEYTLADHLGNSRVTFADIDGNGFISASTEILQENHYYPFGLAQEGNWTLNTGNPNDYLYNGKELDTDFGLNWYHYGARMYDPAVGRFTGVDPISDQFPHVSTYNYAENEPIAHIDLWGLQKVLAIFFHGGPNGGGNTTTAQASGPTGEIFNNTQKAALLGDRSFNGRIIAPDATSASGVSNGLSFAKDNYESGDQVILYGYSYGVDVAVDLASELKGENIPVELLITVDGSDGPLQNTTVNTSISENVKNNLNIYQTDDSSVSATSATSGLASGNSSSQSSSVDSGTSNFPGSNGAPNTAVNNNKTKVINKNVTASGTTHGNIQQKQQSGIQNAINKSINNYKNED